ncbi:MAG: hypothetical protein CSA26_07985 [Desulfobacterales bacterium]|nr:MAG: hypothetical protein CSA26_07985 [Desulfobacterales bacterium]
MIATIGACQIIFYHESSPVPEPCTIVFLGFGLAGITVLARRRKRG